MKQALKGRGKTIEGRRRMERGEIHRNEREFQAALQKLIEAIDDRPHDAALQFEGGSIGTDDVLSQIENSLDPAIQSNSLSSSPKRTIPGVRLKLRSFWVAAQLLGVIYAAKSWSGRPNQPISGMPKTVILRARELGLPDAATIFGQGDPPPSREILAHAADAVENLRRQITNTEREIRERRLWIVALVSAIASAISAVAAWMAVWVSR